MFKTLPARLALLGLALVVCLFSGLPAKAADGPEEVRIAVLPFQVNAPEDLAYLRQSLPDLLVDGLAREGFTVIPQKEVAKIIQEQEVTYVDLQMAKDLALLSGATYSVYGSFTQVGESISLDVRLVDAFGLKPATPLFVAKDGIINLMPAVDELVKRIKFELMKKERIAQIKVEGNRFLDAEVILMRLGISKGDIYDPKQINADLKKIYALGYFDDVQVQVADSPDGKVITFDVKEKPLIQAIGVKGADAISEDDIISAVNTKKGAVLNPKVLADDLATVKEMYRKEGHYNAKVGYELESEDNRRARLNFVVDEGKELYIQEIIIEGATQLDAEAIKSELALDEEAWHSFITNFGVLKEELLERDAAMIETFYADRGFLNVKVGQPEVQIKEDGIYIIFKVEEGSRYKVGKIVFKGDLIVSNQDLMNVIGMDQLVENDEYFNRSVLRQDLKLLTDFYADFGYAYAESDCQFSEDAEHKTVDIVYQISKHQLVYIRRVLVEGNTKTRDNVILREMRLSDGDKFSGSKLRRSTERLNKLDFFSEVDIQPVPTGDPSEMDLKIRVKDKSTGSISGGVGYSTYESFFLSAKLEERNLFGKGYDVSLSGTWSGRRSVYVFNFMNPHIYDSKLGGGFDIYNRENKYDSFKRRGTGGTLYLSYPLGEYTRVYGGYGLEYYDVYDIPDNAASTIKNSEGTAWSSVLNFKAVRDTTDRRINPREGTINTALFQFGGGPIGGKDSFLKFVYDFRYFKELFWESIFSIRTQAGIVGENIGGDEVPVFQRFFLGGIQNVRGYSDQKISPVDEATGDRIGGNKEFFVNFEQIFPLSQDLGLWAGLVFSMGNTWNNNEMFFESVTRPEGDSVILYKGIGPTLRWYSPMGPLEIGYTYGLDKLEGSNRHQIEFKMGGND